MSGGTSNVWNYPIKNPTEGEKMNKPLLQPVNAKNPIVFLDINIDNEFAGRMIIELRSDVVPRSAENFRGLCTGEYGIGRMGKPLHFKGIRFHKVIKMYAAQCGDVVNNDGTCGESIYGTTFEDESFKLEHDDEGIVSMANYGQPNTNNSQFFITSMPCSNLNGTNVVVGKVLRGLGISWEMDKYTNKDDSIPIAHMFIVNCGEIKPGEDWGINDNDESGESLPPYPPDWPEKFSRFTVAEMSDILISIRNAGNFFFKKQDYYKARQKYRKANRYYNLLRKRTDWPEFQHLRVEGEDLSALDDLYVLNNVNMAAVELKLNNFTTAIKCCQESLRLDDKCGKAYYRIGQAQIVLDSYEDAIENLKKAQELIPENRQVVAELNRAKQLMAAYNRNQMAKLKKLFK